ncbi:MAG: aldo/keto reductase, partial [Armatimonadota bacterium]|nr:aldo/keto reductase [Armatimonadota bacterium]
RPPGSRFERGSTTASRLNDPAIERANALRCVAERRGITLAQLALAWVHQQPGVTAPILGARTLQHLLTALPALEVRLTPEEQEEIDRIAPPGSAVSDYWDVNTFRRLRRAS